jgi:hypothetical protein
MEEIKQEAINILMLAKEIQQQTGCTFDNAIKAIELGEKVGNSAMYTKMVEFGINEYKDMKAKEEARRAKWDAEQQAEAEQFEAAQNQAAAEAETAEAKSTKAKPQ